MAEGVVAMALSSNTTFYFDGQIIDGVDAIAELFQDVPPLTECRLDWPDGEYRLFKAIVTPKVAGDYTTADLAIYGAVLEGNIYDREGAD